MRRQGQLKTFTLQPVLSDGNGAPSEKRYRVGIASEMTKVTTLPFTAALRRSVQQNKEGSLLILELVRKMIERKISIRSIEGPIGIGRADRTSCQEKRLDAALGIDLDDQLKPGHL